MSNGIHKSLSKPLMKPGKILGIDKRFLAPILITCILAVGEYQYRILESYWATGVAIATSILAELVLGRIATGKWPHLASAYVSGISVGILVRSHDLWVYALCAMLSISSKYALRIKDRHLWNPSNLGVSVLLLLIPTAIAPLSQQWGNEYWPSIIIFILGSMILGSLGRFHITLTYAVTFTMLCFVRAGLTNESWRNEVALLTAPSYQLFMFFMITDPKSTTRTKPRQCLVAVIVAVTETIFRLCRNSHAPYYALFVTAPATNLAEIIWDTYFARKPGPFPQPAPSAAPATSTGITTPQETAMVVGASSPMTH